MFTINAEKEEVLNIYPQINEWMDIAKYSILKKDINESKLEFYYSYGYFLPKVEDKEEFYENMYESSSKMKFNERFSFELSKVRVNVTMKIGNFMLSNRMPKGALPKAVVDIVREITKVKMTIEGDYYQNQEIIDSIPEIDRSIVSFEIIKDIVKSDYKNSEMELDLDSVLDKISSEGLDSLSDEERDFLDKKSKGE